MQGLQVAIGAREEQCPLKLTQRHSRQSLGARSAQAERLQTCSDLLFPPLKCCTGCCRQCFRCPSYLERCRRDRTSLLKIRTLQIRGHAPGDPDQEFISRLRCLCSLCDGLPDRTRGERQGSDRNLFLALREMEIERAAGRPG